MKHHRHIAVFRRGFVDATVIEADFAAADRLQTGDHPQKRAFPATGGADKRDEFAIGHVERDSVDDLQRAESLGHLIQSQPSHEGL